MKIPYQSYDLYLGFDHPIKLHPIPTFVMRSVIGKELRRLACITHLKSCEDCNLRKSCAYSYLFETPIEADNPLLKGRNYASHPFILSSNRDNRERADSLELNLTLLGDANRYLSYFYYAIDKAGREGILRERMPYKIDSIYSNGVNLKITENKILIEDSKNEWILDNDTKSAAPLKLMIQFETPLRYKENGKFQDTIDYRMLIKIIKRRLDILAGFYGEFNDEDYHNTEDKIYEKREKKELHWKDYSRYSARQGRELKMGGIEGFIQIEGMFNPYEISLLKAAQLFHIGKNSAFGLGKITINEIKDF